jgi:glutamate-ammonia-ligase adenylyltransferase
MQNAVWQKAISSCAAPERAQQYLEQLKTAGTGALLKKASPEQARVLAALFSGSQALSEWLVAHPDWLAESLDAELLQKPRHKQGLQREVERWLRPFLDAGQPGGAYGPLREFKQREMLRIAARDLGRLADVTEITQEISNVADVCLEAVFRLSYQQLAERIGQPYHQDADDRWQRTDFCIFGLGKLGGQELNYSSDVDVIFVYSEEGHVFKEPPRRGHLSGKGLTNHQFFLRLAEAFIGEVGRLTAEGRLFRIDLRLRPEGNAGPLARSLGSYENYYAQWGQTWERMMLIKARCVAGDAALASEFLEMIQPFRYPRSLSERVLPEIAAMKQRIETEVVKSGEIDRNVKLGRGGIREIEFIVQTLQLLHAGRIPFLQDSQTLPTLQKLVRYKLLAKDEAAALAEAYCFLRHVEHRLQMENNLQTHTIPTERKARERLAALMEFASLSDFEVALQQHTRNVRRTYDELVGSGVLKTAQTFPSFDSGANEWRILLAAHGFRETDRALQLLEEFVLGPGYGHVSPRTSELALQLVLKIIALCPGPPAANQTQKSESLDGASTPRALPSTVLSDPDRVLARLDSFVTAYGSRAMLYETWVSNPSLFELLLLLFDRSEFLAEIAIRTPDLVDELELSGRLRRRKSSVEILQDLRHGLEDEDQRLWLRRYHQAELMRIGLRDILGLADFEQNLVELSALADACLQYALEVVLGRSKMKNAPIAIIGLGKLGGAELNYGSDLDILFVAESKQKNLAALQHLAAEVMDLISSPTEWGIAFLTDARLRPDGEKGLLINTLDTCETYYRRRAQLWEIQALTRVRTIAGNPSVGEQFQTLSARLTNFEHPSQPLAAYSPNWKEEIHKMRTRIENERTLAGQQHLAIKTGAGGLIDAEFVAQSWCLAHGWQEPNTLRALQRAEKSRVLNLEDARKLIENYRQLRRIEGILRRWSYAGETSLPDDPAPLYRVAVRCGFANADNLLAAVTGYRTAIRSVYSQVMTPP